MHLTELFEQCLSADYQQTEEGGNYAVLRKGEALFFFFQASKGSIDWKNNLDFPAMPYRRMGKTIWYAHGGFLRVWKAVEPYLRAAVRDISVRYATVAGYSHGAALGVFCHEYLWFHRPDLRKDLRGVGFGCPRVVCGYPGEGVLSRWENFMVVRNLGDAVTYLPPALLGYRHVGQMLELGARGRYSPIDAHREENIMKELQAL